MGIYAFRRTLLNDQLRRDAADPHSNRDFGRDIIPYLVANGKAVAHRFTRSCVRSEAEPLAYWRDVGTIDAYFDANIDLTDVVPALDLYDRDWPIWTYAEITPPAKFVHDSEGRRGIGISSLISGRLHRLGILDPAHAALHRRAHPFLRGDRARRDPSLRRHRPRVAPFQRDHRRQREDPAGPRASARTRSRTPRASAGRAAACA